MGITTATAGPRMTTGAPTTTNAESLTVIYRAFRGENVRAVDEADPGADAKAGNG